MAERLGEEQDQFSVESRARAIVNGNELGYIYAFPDKRLYTPVDNPDTFISESWKGYEGDIGLYVHVPFCTPKPPTSEVREQMHELGSVADGRDNLCGYCNLFTVVGKDVPEDYATLVLKEIEMYKRLFDGRKFAVSSIYFGGGSPSLLGIDSLRSIFDSLSQVGDTANTSERAIECIPDSVDREKLRQLKDIGFNRISVGVQSFNPDVLRYTGRDYDPDLGYKVTTEAIDLGFDDVNVDLIAGLPLSSEEIFLNDVDTALDISPTTITLYQHMVRELTRFGKQQDLGILPPVDNTEIYNWIEKADLKLQEAGYERVSLTCWTKKEGYKQGEDIYRGIPILGVGAGARSYGPNAHYSTEYSVSTRLANFSIRKWMEEVAQGKFPQISGIKLDDETKKRMKVVLGLMSKKGISTGFINDFPAEFEALTKLGLVEVEDSVRYTSLGKAHSGALARLFFGNNIEENLKRYQHR